MSRTGLNAKETAECMGISLNSLAHGLGLEEEAVHSNPASNSFESSLMAVNRSLEILLEVFGSREAVRAWLNTPHPALDGKTALETILSGKPEAVTLILENALLGIPV